MLLGLAIALLAGCASTSEELQILRADPLAQIEIDSGTEYHLSESQNGTVMRRSRAARILRSFRSADDSSKEQVLIELAEAAEQNGWETEMNDGRYDGSKMADGVLLGLRIFVTDSGVLLTLDYPE